MIHAVCACGRRLSAQESLAGKRVKCPACGQPVPIEAPAPPPAPRAPVVPPAPVPWKLIAVGGLALGMISIVLTLVVLLRKPSAPAPAPASEAPETTALRESLKKKEAELADARSQAARDKRDREEEARRQMAQLEDDNRKLNDLLKKEREERERLEASIKEQESSQVEVEGTEPTKPERDPSIAELVEKHAAAVVVVKTDVGSGAGFFVRADGLVATNFHVVSGSRRVSVEWVGTEGRRSADGRVCAVDLKNDLALIQTVARNVPVLDLGVELNIRVGDAVVAIGSPGIGDKILDNSVSNGIVSALSRELDGVVYIQITAPVNPGNSGGPLLAMSGRVIGIVTAKGRDVENIAFAVPVACLGMLIEHKDGLYRVEGSLAEWESRNGFAFKNDTSGGIPIDGGVIQMQFFEDDKKMVALDYTNNSLVFLDMTTRKVLKSVVAGSEPIDFEFATHGRDVWVINNSSHNAVRISLSRMQVMEKLELPFAPYDIAVSKSYVWLRTADDRLYVLSPNDKKAYATGLKALGLAFDTRHGRLLISAEGVLAEGEADKIAGIAKELAAAKNDKDRSKALEGYEKILKMNAVNVDSRGYRGSSIFIDPANGRVYHSRAVFKADKLDAPLGVFKPNPYSNSSDPAVRAFLQRYPQIDEVRAASPDGKWAANGTHVFHTQTFTVRTEIPVPTIAYCFSKDSKKLYFFDAIHKMVLPLDLVQ